MDMEDANTFEIDFSFKTKLIRYKAEHSWGVFITSHIFGVIICRFGLYEKISVYRFIGWGLFWVIYLRNISKE